MLLYWLVAVLFLACGHVLKAMRWRLFVGVYEKTTLNQLLRALVSGYLLNFYLPLHIGDIARIVMSGRHMKNGCGYATATVLVDRLLDVLFVGLIFGVFAWVNPSQGVCAVALTYGCIIAFLALALGLACVFHNGVKRIVLACCSVFNEKIRFRLLYFFWSLISSVKDLSRTIRLLPLLLETVFMWCAYLASYGFAALGLQKMGTVSRVSDIFFLIFSSDSLWKSTFSVTHSVLSPQAEFCLCAFILVPLPLLLLSSLLVRRSAAPQQTQRLLPQLDASQQLQFLHAYFSADRCEALQEYLSMNRDVSIIRDCSAGSDATTMLCLKDEGMVYRKYAFGNGPPEKLAEQVAWIREHQSQLPLAEIAFSRKNTYSFCYDMRCDPTAVGMFAYICSHSTSQSWEILHSILQTLQNKLYQPGAKVSTPMLEQYIREKIRANLDKITQHRALQGLCKEPTLIINGLTYRGLPQLMPLFDTNTLLEVFSEDQICAVHGDLTIENIVCLGEGPDYYLIDPNPSNPIETPGIDYGKLLQSLHGRYELLSLNGDVQTSGASIHFPVLDAPQYQQLYQQFDQWLYDSFPPRQVQSIYYHEMVHWLRLLPYKLRKNEKTALRFFAAMIVVMNDIYTRFEENQHETKTGDF